MHLIVIIHYCTSFLTSSVHTDNLNLCSSLHMNRGHSFSVLVYFEISLPIPIFPVLTGTLPLRPIQMRLQSTVDGSTEGLEFGLYPVS